ncbi:MAG: hypothetical protein HYY02_08105 [Chloroflexi bacterium]|nr:hypothetical protein [Chloroflexota bacterium]
MGVFRKRILVRNPQSGQSLETEALVDTGSTLTVLPIEYLRRLEIAILGTRSFELADKNTVELTVGYAEVTVEGGTVLTLCAFGESVAEPILSATTLELLFLAVDPARKELLPVQGLLM